MRWAYTSKRTTSDEAEQALKTTLGPHIQQASVQDRAMYNLFWGDLIYLQQEANKWNKPENHRRILKYYQQAQELGHSLSPLHLQRFAETFVALKRDREAMELIARLKDAPARRRYSIVKRIIERRKKSGPDALDIAPLLVKFDEEVRGETDKVERRRQEMWSVQMQGRGLLEVGEPREDDRVSSKADDYVYGRGG